MNAYRLSLILILLVVLVPFATGISIPKPGTPGWSPNVIIIAEEITPEPVEPGSDFTVKVRIRNNGFKPATGLRAILQYEYPFILLSENQDFDEITLCVSCSKDNTYYLKAAPTATTGVYTINFDIWRDDVKIKGVDQTVSIEVRGVPDLVLTSPNVGDVAPNTDFTSEVNVTNIGTGWARRIKIQPADPNFVVLGGDIRTLPDLAAGKSASTNFTFFVSENLAAGVYNIPITLDYESSRRVKFNDSQKIGVRVIQVGYLNIENIKVTTFDGSTELHPGKQFAIIARIENIGDGEADAVTVELDCPLDGQKRSFVGKLKPDEDSPASFTLVARRSGHYECDLILSFNDDRGPHTTTQKIDIYIGANNIFLKFTLFIVVIISIAYGVRWYLHHIKQTAILPDERPLRKSSVRSRKARSRTRARKSAPLIRNRRKKRRR